MSTKGFVYQTPPTDDFAFQGWGIPPLAAEEVVRAAEACIQRARMWEGDGAAGPYVMQLPCVESDGRMWVVALKIRNNGTTFIWSPIPLPHLSEYEDPIATL
jgi:hypothetical protein